MVRAAAVVLFIFLSGCKQVEDANSRAEWAADQASANFEQINSLRDRIEALEREKGEIEAENRRLASRVEVLSHFSDSIAEQVSENAKKYNQHLDDYAKHRHY